MLNLCQGFSFTAHLDLQDDGGATRSNSGECILIYALVTGPDCRSKLLNEALFAVPAFYCTTFAYQSLDICSEQIMSPTAPRNHDILLGSVSKVRLRTSLEV